MALPYCPRRGARANNHDIPELMPVPEQLHVFDVYRMRVRFLRSDLQGFTGRLSRNDAIRVANAVGEVEPEEQVWL